MEYRRSIVFAALGCVCAAGVGSASEPLPYAPGERAEATIAGESVVSYALELGADVFVVGHADQVSVDAVVTVFGPDNEQRASFDETAEGHDRFVFETDEAGVYRFELSGYEGDEGEVAFEITSTEPVAAGGPERVDQLMARFAPDEPGGVIGVFRGGETLFARAYGMANLAYDIPFTTQTPTNIGSVSKQFTAFGIALLDQRGELSLDDDVRTHVPELPDFGETVTLRHLVCHVSGYREFLNTVLMSGRRLDRGDSIGRDEIVAIIQRQPELQNEPGAEWNYNNSGYGLLAIVVERVTGEDFDAWMRANVFEPMGMDTTVFRDDPSRIVRGMAEGYAPSGESFVELRALGAAMGAGAMYTTDDDMGRWIRNFATGGVGGPTMYERMTTTYVLTDGEDTSYALGLFIDEFEGLERVQHGGADAAHRAQLSYFPSIDAGVVTMSNRADFDAMGIANDVARAFFAEHMTPEADDEVAADGEDDGEAFDPASYDPAWFEPLAGRYELEVMPGFVLSFTERDGVFYTLGTGQPDIDMDPTGRTTFAIPEVQATLEFHLEDDGTCERITLTQGQPMTATRVRDAAWAPDADELAAYEGLYYSDELRTVYELRVDDEGRLTVSHVRYEDPLVLSPSKVDAFTGSLPLANATFERDDTGNIVRMLASNGRTRGVVFVKWE